MQRLPYFHTFTHTWHEPAILLVKRLFKMTSSSVDNVFFISSRLKVPSRAAGSFSGHDPSLIVPYEDAEAVEWAGQGT